MLASAIATSLLLGQGTSPVKPGTQAPKPKGGYRLAYDGEHFVVTSPTGQPASILVEEVPVTVRTNYRKDETHVYWDETGLTISSPGRTFTTRLEEIAVTPKLFTTDEIVSTRNQIQSGYRQAGADSLSGSARVGNFAYFLLAWHDSKGKPWCEALVRVSLVAARPKPELLGRFDGFTLAAESTSDELKLSPGGFTAITKRPSGVWGMSSYNIASGKFKFSQMGEQVQHVWAKGGAFCVASETEYGRVVLSRVVAGKPAQILAEVKGTQDILGDSFPWTALVQTNLGSALLNLQTGQQANLPPQALVRQVGNTYVVWVKAAPEKATLLSALNFAKLATAVKVTPA